MSEITPLNTEEQRARERDKMKHQGLLGSVTQHFEKDERRHQGLLGSVTQHFEKDERRHQGLLGSITEAFKKRKLNEPSLHYKGKNGKEYRATDQGLAAMQAAKAASWESQLKTKKPIK